MYGNHSLLASEHHKCKEIYISVIHMLISLIGIVKHKYILKNLYNIITSCFIIIKQ